MVIPVLARGSLDTGICTNAAGSDICVVVRKEHVPARPPIHQRPEYGSAKGVPELYLVDFRLPDGSQRAVNSRQLYETLGVGEPTSLAYLQGVIGGRLP